TAIRSNTTGGGWLLTLIRAGSIIVTPLVVANQSFPSFDFQPAGCDPPLHSRLAIPSDVSYDVQSTELIRFSAKSFKSLLLARKMPRLQLIQKLPVLSSSS